MKRREMNRDYTGHRFGRLLVVGFDRKVGTHRHWIVQCDCGRAKSVRQASLVSGLTTSCGCLQKERAADIGRKSARHGKFGTPIYAVWSSMIARCSNPSADSYKNYGGRGISVCERWRVFKNFLADMGDRPTGMSLDRIDVNGNYEPGNCRWATQKEQMNNTTKNRRLTLNGRTMNVTEWAETLGINRKTLETRVARGWSAERALTAALERKTS